MKHLLFALLLGQPVDHYAIGLVGNQDFDLYRADTVEIQIPVFRVDRWEDSSALEVRWSQIGLLNSGRSGILRWQTDGVPPTRIVRHSEVSGVEEPPIKPPKDPRRRKGCGKGNLLPLVGVGIFFAWKGRK